MCENLYYN